MGIEPMTSFLPRMRSTPELRGLAFYITTSCQKYKTSAAFSKSGRRRIRTYVGVCQLIYSQPRLATSVSAQIIYPICIALGQYMEPTMGLEPMTCRLQSDCSTD